VEERGIDPAAIMALVRAKSRDNARMPMQWDASANAGFTTGMPWIKVNPNYTDINGAQALSDPKSVFHYYQQPIRPRT
jgi:oligo-1,6-glucosidase